MLPTYVILNLTFGLVFLFDPDDKLSRAPGLAYARDVLSIEVWGWLWLLLGVMMLVALLWPRAKRGAELGLATNVVAWTLWAVVVEKAADARNVSYLAGLLPLFVAVASFASMVSVLRNETDGVG